jgi:hypothetical protein
VSAKLSEMALNAAGLTAEDAQRDQRRERPQLVIGPKCAATGCPVSIEVFEGDAADPMTLAVQIKKRRQRFNPQRLVMVGRPRHPNRRAH